MPGLPWSVRRVDVELTLAGPSFVYTLKAGSDGRDVLTLRDRRDRLALEAFSALPLDAMQRELEVIVAAEHELDQRRLRSAFADLASFSKRFGPLGIGWGMTLPVTNPAAERAERQLRDTERQRRGREPSEEPWPKSPWVVSFYGQAAGRRGFGDVRRLAGAPRPHDTLDRIGTEQRDLRMALQFVEAIARDDERALRALIKETEWARGISLRVDPQGTDWRRVRIGGPRLGRRAWDPFAPGEDVDWRLFARLLLSNLVSRQLAFVLPYVDIDAEGRFRQDLRPTSVLEVIYMQLLEHVQERLSFGVTWCGYCGGAILRTRKPGSRTTNRWHGKRCANAGRAVRHRAKHGKR
jgi:hypothetical protein